MVIKYILKILNNNIRKFKIIPRIVFNAEVEYSDRIYWDFTTLALRNCLKKKVTKNSKILEVGTGPYALLLIYLWKKFKCDLTGCDINKEYTENALKSVRLNNAELKIIESDLFENIYGKFDIIFFNSVYIPRNAGKKFDLYKLHKFETDWCGGETGTEIIRKYLVGAKKHLTKGGIVLLGFNPSYIKRFEIEALCKATNYKILSAYNKIINPSVVLILK